MCNIHQIRIQQAFIEAKMSKCVKAKVGCILVDNAGRIAGSGYNGTRKGEQNCCERFPDYERRIGVFESEKIEAEQKQNTTCKQWPIVASNYWQKKIDDLKKEHRDWAAEHEIHAEMNVLLSSDRSDYFGGTLYVTHKPCKRCAPIIAASGLIEVVYSIDGLTGDSDDSIFGNVKLTQVGEA
ncbi:zinc-binding cytidine and deoxycytidylate deaminase [Vibrio phage 3.058.O._10N.286.46.B8]|nr:zinc-binding cytidine and deoxycytidylate deaminase [Vibrio phage 2.058.O._10N.286.46.B8]AUS03160.1 zinc-binding cytidine and deoxycytidylate deaminase [Vibrio phage 3.058.O._10N.286.46.B8]